MAYPGYRPQWPQLTGSMDPAAAGRDPVTIPLVIQWVKPEVKARFGAR